MHFCCGFRDLLKRPSRMIGANVLFYLPVVRELTLFFGGLDADKETVEMLLREGVNVELYPGAMDEMIQPGTVYSKFLFKPKDLFCGYSPCSGAFH